MKQALLHILAFELFEVGLYITYDVAFKYRSLYARLVYFFTSASSLIEDAIYDKSSTHGIWVASVLEYIHTMLLASIMVISFYQKISSEESATSIWLVLIRLLDSLLFSMSNLPGISRILYILTIRVTATYLMQVLLIYTLYTAFVAILVSTELLNRNNAANYLVCQTAASVYILIKLAVVLKAAIKRPRISQRLRIRYLDNSELNETTTL